MTTTTSSAAIHYCFLTFGTINNPSYVRARELGKALLDRGVTVSYIVDETTQHTRADMDPRALVEFVPGARRLSQFRQRRAAIEKLKPDFIEVLNPNLKTLIPLIGGRGRAGGPKVVAYWDEPPVTKICWSWPRAKMEPLLDWWLRRRAELHVVSTRYLEKLLRERDGIEALYQPYACYLPDYPDGPSPFAEPTVVYMGNYHVAWDLDIFFHAFDLLAKRGVKPKLVVIGGGPDRPIWEKFIAERGLDNIELAGFMTGAELFRRLRHAYVLLFPMRKTLMHQCRCPSKTFAYAQSRRPVITTRWGEPQEVLGAHGRYVEPTPEAFADAIEQAMQEPRPADVDYELAQHTWPVRVETLLAWLPMLFRGPAAAPAAALAAAPAAAPATAPATTTTPSPSPTRAPAPPSPTA